MSPRRKNIASALIEVLDQIPFKPETDRLLARLRFQGHDSNIEDKARDILGQVAPLARPKAIYLVSYISRRGPGFLEIDGVKFTSPLLLVNLEKANQVFPFVITGGQEIYTV